MGHISLLLLTLNGNHGVQTWYLSSAPWHWPQKADCPWNGVGAETKERVREEDGSDSEGRPTKRVRADNSVLLPSGNDEQNIEVLLNTHLMSCARDHCYLQG